MVITFESYWFFKRGNKKCAKWEISGFVRAAWSVLRMTEASETTKWSPEADNILCVCSSVWGCMCACLLSWASFWKCLCTLQDGICVWGVFLDCCASVCVCVCSVMSLTWQARTLIQSGGGSIWKRQGAYREQMIFIGLKRSGWPAGLVATTGVMLHYDLKMTGDDAAPKRGEREEEEEVQEGQGEEWQSHSWGHLK